MSGSDDKNGRDRREGGADRGRPRGGGAAGKKGGGPRDDRGAPRRGPSDRAGGPAGRRSQDKRDSRGQGPRGAAGKPQSHGDKPRPDKSRGGRPGSDNRGQGGQDGRKPAGRPRRFDNDDRNRSGARGHGGGPSGGRPKQDRNGPKQGLGDRRGRGPSKPRPDDKGNRRRDERPPRSTAPAGKHEESVAPEKESPRARELEPELPEDANGSELDAEVRRELRGLPKVLADKVAVHLVAAGRLIDTDPERALVHARFARKRASRVASVREANGLTAYQVGEWNEALSELRAARRMAGGAGQLAVMADCERALGRPERALDLSRSPEAAELTGQQAVELRIVAAGARRDLGQVEASVVSLQGPDLDPQRQEPYSARLFYAYADNLLAAGRTQEAFTWFVHAAHADDDEETDAPERLDGLVEELGGVDAAEELVAEVEGVSPDADSEDVGADDAGVEGASEQEGGQDARVD